MCLQYIFLATVLVPDMKTAETGIVLFIHSVTRKDSHLHPSMDHGPSVIRGTPK